MFFVCVVLDFFGCVDLDGRSELLEKGFDTTPVTMIGDIWISGFDTHEIDEALANTGQM